jgi:N-glycosylase/DNA lyase
MRYLQKSGEVEITGFGEFDLERTFECGQCFRWNPVTIDSYVGIAFGRAARIRRDGDSLFISGTISDVQEIWRDYFDLDRDYDEIRRSICIDEFMTAAAGFGAGIRILRQEKWEALCSFILSQCNNIPRIKKIIETFCLNFGEPVAFEGRTYYTFPQASRVAALSAEELAPLRCGYRAPYIIKAARAVADGLLDLEALSAGTPSEALEQLKKLNGVGDKVASCAVLFGLHMLDSFPVDVWMKRALTEQYGKSFNPCVFSPYAGVAQQYIFHFARNGGMNQPRRLK